MTKVGDLKIKRMPFVGDMSASLAQQKIDRFYAAVQLAKAASVHQQVGSAAAAGKLNAVSGIS